MIKNSNEHVVIPPGSTIGILGSGQLGRMMAISAKQMGYRVHVLSPSHDSPAGQVADLEIQAAYGDLEKIRAFAKHVDVVTIESENIPISALDAAAEFAPAYPGRSSLMICQMRSMEKKFLRALGIPTCQFKVVHSLEELQEACEEFLPAVLKTSTGGYDGKGQVVIRSKDEIENAWTELNTSEAVLEEWVEFDFEFSVVGIRNSAGLLASYASIENEHKNGILDVSVSPSRLSEAENREATKAVYEIMTQLESVGVLAVEFFYRNGEILVNEIAPRPHNSGHLTIEGHMTNQFEQHVRAICGLLPGSTRQLKPVAMANLLGSEWADGEPNWHLSLTLPNTSLHLYGKGIPESGRKMGHMTSIANSPEQAKEHVLAARKLLRWKPASPSGLIADRGRTTQPV